MKYRIVASLIVLAVVAAVYVLSGGAEEVGPSPFATPAAPQGLSPKDERLKNLNF